jgi:VCBS repeat protein/ASPIC/UnbV protein
VGYHPEGPLRGPAAMNASARILPALLLALGALAGCGPAEEEASRAPAAPVADEDWPSQRPEFERVAAELFQDPKAALSRTQAGVLRAKLTDPGLTEAQRFDTELELADRLMFNGELDAALAVQKALLERVPAGSPRAALVARAMGLVYLRQAETQNCVQRHNSACCIFPIEGGGLHTERGPAEESMRCFETFLGAKPDNLRARWLLNVAAMALGRYPDGLAPERLVPLEPFASEYDIGRFPDVAGKLGVDSFSLAGGVVVEDFDGDGRLDILTSTCDPLGPLVQYANRGSRGFEDVSAATGAADQLGGLNLIAADYDNDGDPDLFVLRGAWLTTNGKMRRSLLRNDGGKLRDVTARVGLLGEARPSQTAAFGDLDDDGDLDLFVGNESDVAKDPTQDHPSQLYRNDGGVFTDVAAAAGVENDLYCKAVALGDYDNDGDLDAYFSNLETNRLYRNEGGLRFVDVAAELAVEEPRGRSFASWFFDVDEDGWLDLWVPAFEGSIAELTADALRLPGKRPMPCLYHNLGGQGKGARFEDVTARYGLARFFLPMGSNFGDLDNDGWLDMYLGTGDPSLESIMPNVMLRNDGGRRFQDVTISAGTGHLQKGHGVAFADLDQDGDQDIYHQLGGFVEVDRYRNALFRNPGHGNHWLHVELRGTKTNRQGIGARVTVVLATPEGPRELHRAVGCVSSFGGSPMRQEIGLGKATRIERLEVVWPTSGERSVFTTVPMDALVRVTEDSAELERLAHEPSAW